MAICDENAVTAVEIDHRSDVRAALKCDDNYVHGWNRYWIWTQDRHATIGVFPKIQPVSYKPPGNPEEAPVTPCFTRCAHIHASALGNYVHK